MISRRPSVVGNMCKVATILVNTFIWDRHSSPTGILSLFICLGSGAMYSQAPMKSVEELRGEEVLPCLSRQSYRWIVLQPEGVYGICMRVLIAMCVILPASLSLEGNEVAIGTTNRLQGGEIKWDDDDDDDDDNNSA